MPGLPPASLRRCCAGGTPERAKINSLSFVQTVVAQLANDSASEYLVLVDVIGAEGGDEEVDNAVQAIISHIQNNPMPNDCIGHIENVGGIPSPVSTTEGRLVYRLQFACLYGE